MPQHEAAASHPDRAQDFEGRARRSVTPFELASVLLRHRQVLIWAPFALAVLVVGLGLTGKRKFTSTLGFVPQVSDPSLSGAGAIAAQFGVSVPGTDLTQTPDFYAWLLRSDQMARDLVDSRYRVRNEDGDSVTANLTTLFKVKAANPALARDFAALALSQRMKVSSDLRTGAVRLDVTTTDPSLSAQIGQRALHLVNEFNTNTRRSRFGEERKFLISRIDEARGQLRVAEDKLQSFLDNNRDYTSSPPLVFAHDRLQREVLLKNQLYTTFAQQLEDARVQEARNTPVVTVVVRPIPAVRPDTRGLAYKGIGTMAFGMVLTAFVLIVGHMLKRAQSSDDAETREFTLLLREAADGVVSKLRRLTPWRRSVST